MDNYTDDEFEQELKECKDILQFMEEMEMDMPIAAEDFASDVIDKAQSIVNTIEERKVVTESQMRALQNMENGMRKWIK